MSSLNKIKLFLITVLSVCTLIVSAQLETLGKTEQSTLPTLGAKRTIYYDPSNPPQVFKSGVGYGETV